MVVDMKVVYTLNMSDHIKYIELVVDDTVDGQDNQWKETMDVGDIMIYLSVQLECSLMRTEV